MLKTYQIAMEDPIVVYDSTYQTLLHYPGLAFYEEIWKTESDDLTDDLYKEDFLKLIQTGFRIPFDKVLIDHRAFHFVISPELQIWHNTHIFAVSIQYIKGKTKVANLVTEDFCAQLSIEQTFDEVDNNTPFEARYFSDREEALGWLFR